MELENLEKKYHDLNSRFDELFEKKLEIERELRDLAMMCINLKMQINNLEVGDNGGWRKNEPNL